MYQFSACELFHPVKWDMTGSFENQCVICAAYSPSQSRCEPQHISVATSAALCFEQLIIHVVVLILLI